MKNTTVNEKEKATKFNILPILSERYSPRIFADTPVSEVELRTLFEAGRWAPSSYNRQPWRIIWGIKGSKTYDRIFDCLGEFNQSWAKNAPVLLLNAFKKTTDEGNENFHALHDLGLFMGNVTAQAQHLGIALHQMAGVDHQKAKKEFKFPEEYHVATAVAVGYYGGSIEDLPEDLRSDENPEERTRKMQREFTFNGDFMDDLGLNSSNQETLKN
ncbi:nitroreductase family protein [Aquimarina sp. U1-2]|uniref:nitroreductase family protein n=1 Tax=Aquimarina sp. U1-2 TaxID=2823141 RepID=UPI001AECAC6D|nr:nitroreductase family protein [Aquimarina sp. U1-2]MBP2830688.1 nitroreductase family protein [Aquimarina sp. U1-2]